MKYYNVIINDEYVSGTPIELVKKMSEQHFFNKYESLEDYIEQVTHDIWRLYTIGITINGITLEEKCEQLIEQLIHHGLLKTF